MPSSHAFSNWLLITAKFIEKILFCNSWKCIASSAPFLVFLIFQLWLGQRQHAGQVPGIREQCHQSMPESRRMLRIEPTSLFYLKILFTVAITAQSVVLWVLLDKTDIHIQNQSLICILASPYESVQFWIFFHPLFFFSPIFSITVWS